MTNRHKSMLPSQGIAADYSNCHYCRPEGMLASMNSSYSCCSWTSCSVKIAVWLAILVCSGFTFGVHWCSCNCVCNLVFVDMHDSKIGPTDTNTAENHHCNTIA